MCTCVSQSALFECVGQLSYVVLLKICDLFFVFTSARITWFDKPIDRDFTPGEDSFWAYQRLHDPYTGVFSQVFHETGVTPVTSNNARDDFITEGLRFYTIFG